MDFSWTPHINAFWVLPLLCLLFMAIMMLACHAMPFRFGHCARSEDRLETVRQVLDRRYTSGEIDKDRYEAMRRDLDG